MADSWVSLPLLAPPLCDKLGSFALPVTLCDVIVSWLGLFRGSDKSGHVQRRRVKQDARDEVPQVCLRQQRSLHLR